MTTFNPGKLDTPCKVWEYTYTQNQFGEPVYTWIQAPRSPRWCSVEPLRGFEKFAAQQTLAESTAKITIRRWAGIHQTQELEFRGDRWNITSIEDHGRAGIQVLYVKRK